MNDKNTTSSFDDLLRSLGMERPVSEASLVYSHAENHEDLQFEFNHLLMSLAFGLVQCIYPHRISGIGNAFRRRFRPHIHRTYWQRVCAVFAECANISVGYARRMAAPLATMPQLADMFDESVPHSASFLMCSIRTHPTEKNIMREAVATTVILAEEFPPLKESEVLERLSEANGVPVTARQFIMFNLQLARVVDLLDPKAYCTRWCVLFHPTNPR